MSPTGEAVIAETLLKSGATDVISLTAFRALAVALPSVVVKVNAFVLPERTVIALKLAAVEGATVAVIEVAATELREEA